MPESESCASCTVPHVQPDAIVQRWSSSLWANHPLLDLSWSIQMQSGRLQGLWHIACNWGDPNFRMITLKSIIRGQSGLGFDSHVCKSHPLIGRPGGMWISWRTFDTPGTMYPNSDPRCLDRCVPYTRCTQIGQHFGQQYLRCWGLCLSSYYTRSVSETIFSAHGLR